MKKSDIKKGVWYAVNTGYGKPASACENCDCDDPTATPGLADDCDCAHHKNTDKEP